MKFIKLIINEEYIDSNGSLKDLSQSEINEILKGYLECALWTEQERLEEEANSGFDEDDEDDFDDMDEIEKLIRVQNNLKKKPFTSFLIEDIEVDSRISAYVDIKTFIKNAGDVAVQEAINENGLFQLGMDIWLTRNGHGAGFFDHWYDNDESLVSAAKNLEEIDLRINNNDKLYFY